MTESVRFNAECCSSAEVELRLELQSKLESAQAAAEASFGCHQEEVSLLQSRLSVLSVEADNSFLGAHLHQPLVMTFVSFQESSRLNSP